MAFFIGGDFDDDGESPQLCTWSLGWHGDHGIFPVAGNAGLWPQGGKANARRCGRVVAVA